MAGKLDLLKANRAEYATPAAPALVHVGPAQYLAVDGEGEPSSGGFGEAVGALYGVAFTIKMKKKREGQDYAVAPLEGLWWSAGSERVLPGQRGESWRWTALIRTPDFITPAEVEAAAAELERKGKGGAVRRVRLERLEEGDCVQVLHVGSWSAEGPTIEALHAFAAAQGRALRGKHHEIYLSDPRRVPVERLRTIVRQPVGRGDA